LSDPGQQLVFFAREHRSFSCSCSTSLRSTRRPVKQRGHSSQRRPNSKARIPTRTPNKPVSPGSHERSSSVRSLRSLLIAPRNSAMPASFSLWRPVISETSHLPPPSQKAGIGKKIYRSASAMRSLEASSDISSFTMSSEWSASAFKLAISSRDCFLSCICRNLIEWKRRHLSLCFCSWNSCQWKQILLSILAPRRFPVGTEYISTGVSPSDFTGWRRGPKARRARRCR
jgi:hypothetical protein